jgi:hypothetical protein
MKTYIGVKIVQAEPESKDGKEGLKVIYEEGFESWCPKDVFEKHNRPTEALSFSFALEAARQGKKIARLGWEGTVQYVVLKPGYPQGIPCNAATAKAHGIPEGTLFYYGQFLELKSRDNCCLPWVASQSDLLHDDWYIVE